MPPMKSHEDTLNHRILIIPETGTEILLFDELPSTMNYAIALAKKKVSPWTAVIARKQSSGRGTHGRLWFSTEAKGLWTSVILPPPECTSVLEDLSLMAAGCLAECLKKLTGFKFDIKHPNDVVINNRKIAGILFESVTLNGIMDYLILGMGVNLFQNKSEFDFCELYEATSVLIETGIYLDPEDLLKEFLIIFKASYEKRF